MPFVYILKSIKNGTYYIGSTVDLERRIEEHNNGNSKYTSKLRPLKLEFNQEYSSLGDARKVENKLKRLKSRKIIERIIKEGYISAGVAQR